MQTIRIPRYLDERSNRKEMWSSWRAREKRDGRRVMRRDGLTVPTARTAPQRVQRRLYSDFKLPACNLDHNMSSREERWRRDRSRERVTKRDADNDKGRHTGSRRSRSKSPRRGDDRDRRGRPFQRKLNTSRILMTMGQGMDAVDMMTVDAGMITTETEIGTGTGTGTGIGIETERGKGMITGTGIEAKTVKEVGSAIESMTDEIVVETRTRTTAEILTAKSLRPVSIVRTGNATEKVLGNPPALSGRTMPWSMLKICSTDRKRGRNWMMNIWMQSTRTRRLWGQWWALAVSTPRRCVSSICRVSYSLNFMQGKPVVGNEDGAVDVKKQRTWRQYMNRYAARL